MEPLDPITLLGLVAAACTTIAFIPQVIKNWRTRSAGDLSFGMFGIFTFGVVMWLVYGLLIGSLPIIAANVITLALNVVNLVQMVLYRKPKDAGRRT